MKEKQKLELNTYLALGAAIKIINTEFSYVSGTADKIIPASMRHKVTDKLIDCYAKLESAMFKDYPNISDDYLTVFGRTVEQLDSDRRCDVIMAAFVQAEAKRLDKVAKPVTIEGIKKELAENESKNVDD